MTFKYNMLALVLLCIISPFSVLADNVVIDDMKYELHDDLTATVTGMVGDIWTGSELNIPNSVIYDEKTYTITAIGDNAFLRYRYLTGSLIIPESVISIGRSAFYGCSGFTGSLTLPESITAIGESAFYGCSGFTGNLTLPESITTIGNYTFQGCSGFTGSLTIPESVTTIGNYTFQGCSGFTGITMSNSVIKIGQAAFDGCEALSEVHISSLESWCKIEFVWATANPLCYAKKLYLNGELVDELVIPESISVINSYAFYNCSNLTGSLTLPNTVKKIGSYAFYECKGLVSVTVPNSVTEIGEEAFNGCNNLKDVHISSLESWCNINFKGFTNTLTGNATLYLNGEIITDLEIPESVSEIKQYAFCGCSQLTSVTIPNSVTSIGRGAFAGCSGLTSIIIPNSVTSIGRTAFAMCSGLTSVTIGNSVTTLGSNIFQLCNNLSEIISQNPEPPTSIESGKETEVFTDDDRKAILKVPVGSEQAYKESPVWSGFSEIVGFAVDASGITLDNSIFELTVGQTITLSATITPDNTTDKTVTWSSSAPAVASVDSNGKVTALAAGTATIAVTTSNGLTASCTVTVVPQTGTIDGIDYEIVIGGGEDGKDIVKVTGGKTDPDGTLRIPDEIEIDGKRYPVTEIGDGAFKNRTDISKLIIPAAVGTVGNEAFAGCTNLVEVEAEDSEKLLDCGTDAFKDTPIATLYLGRDTSGLPFTGKDSLTDLTFGDKVTSIGAGDFTGCGSIKNITVLATVPPTLHDNGFEQVVYKNVSLRVPDTSADDFRKADGWKNFFDVLGINEIRPIEITMELADVELTEGESTTLKAIITPENATDKSVTWSSSESSVASVDATGLVTALKAGTATITATTSNGLTVTCTVTVKAKSAGIDGVDSEGESAVRVEGGNIIAPEGCDVFDLSGRRVTATGLRTGIYIVRIPGGKAVKVRL